MYSLFKISSFKLTRVFFGSLYKIVKHTKTNTNILGIINQSTHAIHKYTITNVYSVMYSNTCLERSLNCFEWPLTNSKSIAGDRST